MVNPASGPLLRSTRQPSGLPECAIILLSKTTSQPLTPRVAGAFTPPKLTVWLRPLATLGLPMSLSKIESRLRGASKLSSERGPSSAVRDPLDDQIDRELEA